jgi:hypothetical protein
VGIPHCGNDERACNGNPVPENLPPEDQTYAAVSQTVKEKSRASWHGFFIVFDFLNDLTGRRGA